MSNTSPKGRLTRLLVATIAVLVIAGIVLVAIQRTAQGAPVGTPRCGVPGTVVCQTVTPLTPAPQHASVGEAPIHYSLDYCAVDFGPHAWGFGAGRPAAENSVMLAACRHGDFPDLGSVWSHGTHTACVTRTESLSSPRVTEHVTLYICDYPQRWTGASYDIHRNES